MKKVIAFVLALALSSFILVGCGGGGSNDNTAVDNEDAASVVEDVAVLEPHTVDLTSDELWAKYKDFSKDIQLTDITLEKLETLFGVDPYLNKEKSSEKNDWYEWYSNDGGGIVVLFSKETGKFVSASQTNP